MKVKLYIEGGGESHLQDTLFREAWRKFFDKAGLKGKMPATYRGGGRNQTFADYSTAVKTRKQNELPLLLVDSENLRAEGDTNWQHLKTRDGWNRPEAAGDDDAFLMICCMETWFLADRSNLQRFFSNCWRNNAVPQWPTLEQVEKRAIFEALTLATADCGRKKYTKGKLSFQLLGEIEPAEVEKRCPAAKELLQRLRAL